MPPHPFPQRYLKEFRPYFHPEDRDLKNPRVRCYYCNAWLTIDARDGTRQVFIQCPHNPTDRRHLAVGMPLNKPALLCAPCCNDHCQPRAAGSAYHPVKPFRSQYARKPRKTHQRPANWDEGSDLRHKFQQSQRAISTLLTCKISEGAPYDSLTERQIDVLLYHCKAWRFYRAQGDDRAKLFLERLQRLAQFKIT